MEEVGLPNNPRYLPGTQDWVATYRRMTATDPYPRPVNGLAGAIALVVVALVSVGCALAVLN